MLSTLMPMGNCFWWAYCSDGYSWRVPWSVGAISPIRPELHIGEDPTQIMDVQLDQVRE
jgi:hypothetical protein